MKLDDMKIWRNHHATTGTPSAYVRSALNDAPPTGLVRKLDLLRDDESRESESSTAVFLDQTIAD